MANSEFLDKPSRFSRRPDWIAATPLFEAASRGHAACVRLLLAAHAAVDQPTSTGETPLSASCVRGHTECVSLLLAAHALMERPGPTGATPLLSALQARQDDVAVVLMETRADVSALLHDGRGVLHCAALAGTSMPVCEDLLSAGASCDARDNPNLNPNPNPNPTPKPTPNPNPNPDPNQVRRTRQEGARAAARGGGVRLRSPGDAAHCAGRTASPARRRRQRRALSRGGRRRGGGDRA